MNNLQQENYQMLALVQALLGNISPNFRCVSLEYMPGTVHLHFILEQESAEDREEINVEIVGEFLALQEFPLDFEIKVTIIVEAEDWTKLPRPRRMAYSRKEPSNIPD